MKLKDLQKIADTLLSFNDFAESNSDEDKSGIAEEMNLAYSDCIEIIDAAKYKIYLRNAKAKNKRIKT